VSCEVFRIAVLEDAVKCHPDKLEGVGFYRTLIIRDGENSAAETEKNQE
jgi:hypothetical protein